MVRHRHTSRLVTDTRYRLPPMRAPLDTFLVEVTTPGWLEDWVLGANTPQISPT